MVLAGVSVLVFSLIHLVEGDPVRLALGTRYSQETYDALFQSWHWRLGGEQLLYSHQSSDPDLRVPRRYLANYKPMLLMCGTEDEVPFNNICRKRP